MQTLSNGISTLRWVHWRNSLLAVLKYLEAVVLLAHSVAIFIATLFAAPAATPKRPRQRKQKE